MNRSNCNPVYTMMSQGINVVVAKTLLDIECNQSQALAAMHATWDDKLRNVKLEYDKKLDKQSNEIQLLHGELRQLKELFYGKSECKVNTRFHSSNGPLQDAERPDSYYNTQDLRRYIKEMNGKVGGLEEASSVVHYFIDDFIKRYEYRNGVVDCAITKHENDLKTLHDAIASVHDQVKVSSKEMAVAESKITRYVDFLSAKFDEHIDGLKMSNESFVSVDEHNQLRINLEDQILECDMKCEHVLLTAQQQWEEYKRRSDEADVVKGVLSTRAKKRREFALAGIQSKYHILTESIDNESKTSEIYDDIVQEDSIMKTCNVVCNTRKVHFHDEIDEPSSDVMDENKGYSPQYEVEDNESEFGNSINLVLLEEHSIH